MNFVPPASSRQSVAPAARRRNISALRASLTVFILLIPLLSFSSSPTVVFMSDFGTIDDSVAICKGVMLGIEPDLRIIDITHEVQPFSIMDAARFLAGTAPHFPSGTVFVVVVDPGVGSVRKPIVVKSRKNQFFVLPDNGLITLVEEADGIESVREITNIKWMNGNALSSTFHGRDIFSPVAAHLASGKDWIEVGPVVPTPIRLDVHRSRIDEKGLTGEIIGTDGPYGNLLTNIPAEIFQKMNIALGDLIHARIGERDFEIPFVKTFSDVAVGQPLFYIDSRGRLGIAINQGNFADAYKIRPPAPIFVYRRKP
ncbi:SAM-dependent chlorinase/fluorinase [bacterium]|nr:SAM-dependent chlorinase/fluorinase [bacterium]